MIFYIATLFHVLFRNKNHRLIKRHPLYLNHPVYHCTCGYLDPTDWKGRPPKEWNRKSKE